MWSDDEVCVRWGGRSCAWGEGLEHARNTDPPDLIAALRAKRANELAVWQLQ